MQLIIVLTCYSTLRLMSRLCERRKKHKSIKSSLSPPYHK
uniref:Uncharacterized protein n=1 Tax=Anguilla anguilla TaxID=7936 RepID=A0A0E9VG21_ANGAN